MELIIFFKSQSNIKSDVNTFEYFKYQTLDKIGDSIEKGIEIFEEGIKDFTKVEFNPLSIDKEKKIIETLQLNSTITESKLMDIYTQIIHENKLINYNEEFDGNTYIFNKLNKLKDATLPAFFYAIKLSGKVYFKKTSNSNLFLQNNYTVLLKRDSATEYKKEDLMIINTNFDFYIEDEEILIKSSFAFEQILKYELVYEKHKRKIISKIHQADVIVNFEEFEGACNKSGYYRAFRKVTQETDFKKSFSNRPFIKRLEIETNNKIKWNDESKKVYIEDLHIKTVLHIFSGLIGIDIYNEIVTFNEKFKLPQ